MDKLIGPLIALLLAAPLNAQDLRILLKDGSPDNALDTFILNKMPGMTAKSTRDKPKAGDSTRAKATLAVYGTSQPVEAHGGDFVDAPEPTLPAPLPGRAPARPPEPPPPSAFDDGPYEPMPPGAVHLREISPLQPAAKPRKQQALEAKIATAYREGQDYLDLDAYELASDRFEEVLKLDPGNYAAKAALRRISVLRESMDGGWPALPAVSMPKF